jgi:hypothetical protein
MFRLPLPFWCVLLLAACVSSLKAGAQQLPAYEDSIVAQFNVLKGAKDDASRDAASESMKALFARALNEADAFTYPFSRLSFSNLTSSDQRVRIINWNVPHDDGTFSYAAFVLIKDLKSDGFSWIELEDQQRDPDKADTKYMTADKWMGALYYEIIPLTTKKRKPADTYVLLGWDGKDFMTTRKFIDAMTIQGKDKVRFGAPIFETPTGARKRIIFEYSEDVSASVRYYPKKQCIVVDHLSPKNPMMEGVYSEYGPDGSYDLYQLEGGKWKLYENIDISKFAESDDRPYADPRRRGRR